jgi:transposase-like protein
MASRKPEQKAQAIDLRKQGYSYNEICQELSIAKSTCSVWLRGIKLNKKAIYRLVDRQDEGRAKAAMTLRQYREERDNYIRQKVQGSLKNFNFTSQVGQLLCAALYWGEGAKQGTALNFTNSDPKMVRVYMTLLRSFFRLDNNKFRALLHLHQYHHVREQRKFWAEITEIPVRKISIYRKPNSGKNIRAGYPGCISIRYYDVRLVKEMEFLYSSLITKYGDVG